MITGSYVGREEDVTYGVHVATAAAITEAADYIIAVEVEAIILCVDTAVRGSVCARGSVVRGALDAGGHSWCRGCRCHDSGRSGDELSRGGEGCGGSLWRKVDAEA